MRKTANLIFATLVAVIAHAQTAPTFDAAQFASQVDANAQQIALAVARLRVDKWKADSQYKQQAQASADSISRNLTEALPGMTAAVHANPADLVANFKLYRNLNALYEVVTSLSESAGAFGPRQDYESIAPLAAGLDDERRNLGAYIENVATRLQSVRGSAASAKPNKRVVIDDSQPVHKKSKKK